MGKSIVRVVMLLAGVFLLLLAGCAPPRSGSSPHLLFHTTKGLWRVGLDGAGLAQISKVGWFADYSPDGSKIAYGEPYDSGIWVADSDGSNPVRLTDFGSGPSWSPDGSQLVFFAGGTAGAQRYLWIMDAGGSRLRQLSRVNGSFPSWSPSGDSILFHGEVNSGIWKIAPDGTNEHLFYRDGGYPAWSPDGTMIAYVDLRDWFIWVMQVDGTGNTPLTGHKGLQPAWSPDGLQVAYDRESRDEDETGIWVINADGTGDHRVTKEGRNPAWNR